MATAGVAELALAVRAVGEVVTKVVATVHAAAAVAMGEVPRVQWDEVTINGLAWCVIILNCMRASSSTVREREVLAAALAR